MDAIASLPIAGWLAVKPGPTIGSVAVGGGCLVPAIPGYDIKIGEGKPAYNDGWPAAAFVVAVRGGSK